MCADDFTEEMLLQSPEKSTVADVVMETAENMQQEDHIDPKVRLFDQKNKEFVRTTNKHISAIVVECEKALGMSFRTTDPIRNSVMESVERQAKVAKAATKILSEQLVEECEECIQNLEVEKRDDIEEGVIEILKVAGLTQTDQLETCLDGRMSDRESLQVLTDMIGCPSSDLVDRVRQLVERANEKSNENEKLTKRIKQQVASRGWGSRRQVRTLQELVSPPQTLMQNDKVFQSGCHPITVKSATITGHIDLACLESIDAHVLLAKRKLQLDKGCERTYVGHRCDPSSVW
ncbi:hypothetical protein Y032_0068g141 [Ancylostoma ceylanicum]|uniref:Uncharacterized protein n=1 Tax=Ancylostoma ceylanicum TaxID=53326 RepID=A0A016TZM9_9BILA|nr:hypothetical protein Y032_0068g141 [Ancylostoma ceylanicum]